MANDSAMLAAGDLAAYLMVPLVASTWRFMLGGPWCHSTLQAWGSVEFSLERQLGMK